MKAALLSRLNFLKPPQPIRPGIYAFQSPPGAPSPLRIHLRVEPNGCGVMVVNASIVLHLNQVATEFAFAYIHQFNEEQTIHRVVSRYRVSKEVVRQDYRSFLEKLKSLVEREDLDPVEFFGFERALVQDLAEIAAPYRLDCALTYQLPEGHAALYAPIERVKNELSTEEWKVIIDKAWAAGIPHLVFTGGEPTLRHDLLELVVHAEKNGQVCGLITQGLIFLEDQTLNDFLNAGLDYLMILLDPQSEESWGILERITPQDIFTAVHLTITPDNFAQIPGVLSRLASIGTNALSLTTISSDWADRLNETAELANFYGLKLVWDLPVPYSKFNPVRLEVLEEEQTQSAGKGWLYLEPDGDVLPGQGIPVVLGNMLTDPWEEIWKRRGTNV